MHVEVLGTWPAIVGTGVREEEWWRIGEWSMKGVELRKLRTI